MNTEIQREILQFRQKLENEFSQETKERREADDALADAIESLSNIAWNPAEERARIVLAHPSAQVPAPGTEDSAGYDLHSVEEVTIWPGKRKTISTGLRIECPVGTYMRIAPRSGLAHKNGIAVMAGVIDRDYTGIIGVILRNTGDDPLIINVGDRIAQGIFERYEKPDFEQVDSLEATGRGDGGYGSTGR